jgi:chemotaxis protein histidine kinase CheA
VGDAELLEMLAAESQRRGPVLISGLEELAGSGKKDPDRLEKLRVEAHGLKGAALVVGQERLAELARLIEQYLAGCVKKGRIEPGTAAKLVTAASAFSEGAQAAAEGVTEPAEVGRSLEALAD